ncbi:hypothetical protein CC85DRAFT_299977 [Cutaneotrichosporon oleaginosum]|uniref:Uncharacterized protein n=1 Tax=Cutaneotrichosporon oleaginosum TaxID=879819 RepID=A0A0J0XVK4_9TREE|nr:uncharacterized protein CC85DRAFT_299977 [Cutaneotrichosporon oleaginosum]KLT45110.1 hypothetical protein CC85DRAFT_299977 [Cutaneotrichosporon oleaginosum]TXT09791.1 hypothetical protein COLE_03725 [Cutaneotrichosporon oleaginosum]
MPPDMPREDYAGPAAYTVSFIGRTIKYIIYGTMGLGATAYLAFEGAHAYVEHVSLAAPSRAVDGDEWAWADENQAWTGGVKGGTDSRLGWRGRHALRGAWICWEWGAGDSGSTISRHPEFKRGMIGASPVNRVDRGYELAEEYIDAAIRVAEAKMAFPPHLPGLREPGPAGLAAPSVPADPTALDLLTLKAGVLERMGPETLDHARELYERVATAYVGVDAAKDGAVKAARAMRLAHKLGDLAQRAAEPDVARAWWAWGLERAALSLPTADSPVAAASGASGWWPFGGSGSAAPSTATSADDLPTSAPLPAPIVRAAVSILVSASAASAQSGALPAAAAIQAEALRLLPPAVQPSVPGPGQGASGLQKLWEVQRRALLTLHAASVAHAQGTKGVSPLEMSAEAAEASEALLSVLNPTLPAALAQPRGNVCTQPAKRLVRDTLTTGAEAYYTEAALLERSAAGRRDKSDALHRLEHAAESYERAMSLSAAEEGQVPASGFGEEDAIGRGEEWTRYWRGYVRVRDKMVRLVEEGAVPTKHA